MATGDFTIPDNTGAASTELTSLFGVAQGVGDTPVQLAAGTAGHMGQGLSRDPQGGTVGGTPAQATTVTHALQGFYGMDKASLTSLQKQLYLGGFYGSSYYGAKPKTPQFGASDDDSFAAFKSAVVQAARSGKVLPQVIGEAVQSVAAGGGPGAKTATAAAILRPPSATDIHAAITDSARKILGHGVDENTINRIVSAYQQVSMAEQQGLNDAQTVGGTVPQTPNLPAFVDQQLQSADPTGAALNTSLHAANLVMQAFGASAGNAPTGGTGG